MLEIEVDVDRRRLGVLGLGENVITISETGELPGKMDWSLGIASEFASEFASTEPSGLESADSIPFVGSLLTEASVSILLVYFASKGCWNQREDK